MERHGPTTSCRCIHTASGRRGDMSDLRFIRQVVNIMGSPESQIVICPIDSPHDGDAEIFDPFASFTCALCIGDDAVLLFA